MLMRLDGCPLNSADSRNASLSSPSRQRNKWTTARLKAEHSNCVLKFTWKYLILIRTLTLKLSPNLNMVEKGQTEQYSALHHLANSKGVITTVDTSIVIVISKF